MVYFFVDSLFSFKVFFYFIMYTVPIFLMLKVPYRFVTMDKEKKVVHEISFVICYIATFLYTFFISNTISSVLIINYQFPVWFLFLTVVLTIFIDKSRMNYQYYLLLFLNLFLTSIWFLFFQFFRMYIIAHFSYFFLFDYLFGIFPLVILPLNTLILYFVNQKINQMSKKISRFFLFLIGFTYSIMALYLLFFDCLSTAIEDNNLRVFVNRGSIFIPLIKKLNPNAIIILEDSIPLMFGVIFVATVIVSICIFLELLMIENMKRKKEVQLIQQREQDLTDYIQNMKMLDHELRKKHHDFANILSGLKGFIMTPEVNEEALKNYFQQILTEYWQSEQNYFDLTDISKIKVPEFSGVLIHKILIAKSKSIKFTLEISDDIEKIFMDSIDFARVIGILLDNAIEAAVLCEVPDVRVACIQENENVVILISNNTVELNPLDVMNKGLYYSGERQRGHGLIIVKEVLTHYSNAYLETIIDDFKVCQKLNIMKKSVKKRGVKLD